MTNTRRKNRWRAKRAERATLAAVHTPAPPPILDNFVLRHAAAGRLSIGDPTHRPPAPITFPAPGRPT